MCELVMVGVALSLTRLRDTGRRLAMPMSDHDASVANGESRAAKPGLLDFAGVSFDDLSRLDDSIVAAVIRDLMRHRCGRSQDGERFCNFEASI